MSSASERARGPVETSPDPSAVGGPYARYVLGVLLLVYVFNFLDRQIVSILAEDIRRDLGISDAQIGFLYGTAFAVFYAIFGIPLGRLADVWNRRSLIAIGLTAWSAMTAVSGLARNFGQLAVARVGVGIGEASATPAAYSLLSDWFPPARRATVLAIYSSGIYIGAGLGLGIGGWVVDAWNGRMPRAKRRSDCAAGRSPTWWWASPVWPWRSGCAACASRCGARPRAWSPGTNPIPSAPSGTSWPRCCPA